MRLRGLFQGWGTTDDADRGTAVRLPFIKLWQNAFERAHVLAPLIQAELAAAIGYQALAWKWGLEMSPEDEVTGVFEDPDIAGLLKAITGYPGDAQRLLSGFVRVHLIELRPPTTFFMVGLPQYDKEARDRETDARRKREERLRKKEERDRLLRASGEDVNDKSSAVFRRSQDDHRTVADASAGIPRPSGGHPEDDPPSGGRPAPSGGRPADVLGTSSGRNGAKGSASGASGGRPVDVLGTSGGVTPESAPQTQTQTQSVVKGRALRRVVLEEEQVTSSPPPPPPHALGSGRIGSPTWAFDAFWAAWLAWRSDFNLGPGPRPDPDDRARLAAFLANVTADQAEGALRAFFKTTDPKARWRKTFALKVFLHPNVLPGLIPAPAEAQARCSACDEPSAELVREREGAPLMCYPCLARYGAAAAAKP